MAVNTTQIVPSKYRSLYYLRNVQLSVATFDALQALHLVHAILSPVLARYQSPLILQAKPYNQSTIGMRVWLLSKVYVVIDHDTHAY